MTILKIHALSEIKNAVLSDRARRAHGGRSTEFIAVVDGVEAGLLSYEDWSDRNEVFIYEIFVLPDFRKRGIGTSLLLHAEALAIQDGCIKARLTVHALDESIGKEVISSWYSGQGYTLDPENPERMAKVLGPTKP